LGYDGAGLRTMALLTLMAFGRGGCLWLVEKEGGWYALGGSRRINYLGVFFTFFSQGSPIFCVGYMERKMFLTFLIFFFLPSPICLWYNHLLQAKQTCLFSPNYLVLKQPKVTLVPHFLPLHV
jgi:hypothetical protein